MSLDPEQIKALLALPERKARAGSGGIDTSVRNYQTWFKLAHKLFNEENPNEQLVCENPNCKDPREGRGIVLANVNGQYMCRFCFLDGWLTVNPEQARLDADSDN